MGFSRGESDEFGTGSISALDGVVTADTQGLTTVVFSTSGTWTGTMRIEGTVDSGATWITLLGTAQTQSLFSAFTSNNTPRVSCGGFQQVRLRMSPYTSGTANVSWSAGAGLQYMQIWNTNAASFEARVEGRIADAVTDAGNPLKTGAKFNATVPTYTDGQRADAQANRNGALSVQYRNTFARITGNTTSTAKSGAGILHSVLVADNQTGGSVTIYDNTAGSGTVIMQLTVGTAAGGLSGASSPGPWSTGPLGIEFATGLTIVTAGSTSNDVTVVFK